MADFESIPINGTAAKLQALMDKDIVDSIPEEPTNEQLPTAKAVDELIKKNSGAIDSLSSDLNANRHNIANISKATFTKKQDVEGEDVYSVFELSCGSKQSGEAFAVFSDGVSGAPIRLSGVADGTSDNDAATCGQLLDLHSRSEHLANRVTAIDSTADDEHYPTAKATWDAIKNQSGSSSGGQGTNYERFFKIDNAGLVSLKPEYRGCPAKNTYPDSISNNGIGVDGSKINELPEVLVIPDVINGITVLALAEGMFSTNYRVKSVTLPAGVTTLPRMVFNSTINLTEVKNTENIEVICQAAFQRCAIEKAMFPNLKAFEGAGQFNMAPKMVIADIGNTVTSIPQNCFSFCEALSCVRGGANVTHIGPKAFIFTYALRSLSFLRQVTFIDWEAFTLSSVTGDGTRDFNWWDFKDNSGCQFGTHPSTGACNATPAHINTTEWFTGCTLPTKCVVNDLGVTFNQANPEFATISLPNSHDTYGSGCLELSATHIYSAFTGDALISTAEFWKNTGVYPGTNSPRVFVESIIANAKNSDGGSLLAPSGNGKDGPYYILGDMGKWLGAMGLQCKLLSGGFNKDNLDELYQEVENGAFAIFSYSYAYNGKSGGHAVVICGVADNGDLFILDSNSYKSEIKDYTSNVFRVPPLCFSGANILTVKK